MNWFNWVGVIVYIVIFISYIATSEMSEVANERTGGGLFGKENILTALSLIFSVFQIVPFCLNMELRDDRWGGWFIAYVVTVGVAAVLYALFRALNKKYGRPFLARIAVVCFYVSILANAVLYLNVPVYTFLCILLWIKLGAGISEHTVPIAVASVGTSSAITRSALNKPIAVYSAYKKAGDRLSSLSQNSRKDRYREIYIKFLDKVFGIYPGTTFNGADKTNYNNSDEFNVHHIKPQATNPEATGDINNLALTSTAEHSEIHKGKDFTGETNRHMLRRVTLKNYIFAFCAAFSAMILGSFLFAFAVSLIAALIPCIFNREKPQLKPIAKSAAFSALLSLVYSVPIGFMCIMSTLSYSRVGESGEWQINAVQIVFSLVIIMLAISRMYSANRKNTADKPYTGMGMVIRLLAFDALYFAGELIECAMNLPSLAEALISLFYMFVITFAIELVSCIIIRKKTSAMLSGFSEP